MRKVQVLLALETMWRGGQHGVEVCYVLAVVLIITKLISWSIVGPIINGLWGKWIRRGVMKKLILKYVRASILGTVTFISAGAWADTKIPVSITHTAASATISSTTLSNGPRSLYTCAGDSECPGAIWFGDPAECSEGGLWTS